MLQRRATRFRQDIEGLRGFAVLLVVLYHVRVPGFSGGYVGVDVFFVLSGFLITQLLLTEISNTGRIDIKQFYARRARRLLPAAASVLSVTMLLSVVVFSPAVQDNIARTASSASIYLSNFYFAAQATDYLGSKQDANPLLHMWSLSVEEQFYVVWPAIVFLAVRLAGRRGLVLVLASVTILSLSVSIRLTWTAESVAFFMMHARAWEFAIGGLTGLISTVHKAPEVRRIAGGTLGWTGIALIVIAATALTELTPFPGVAALLPVGGTALFLAGSSLNPQTLAAKALSTRGLRLLGRLSYSWYLWHWPAITLATEALESNVMLTRAAAAAVSLLLALATYKLVENPLRFHPGLIAAPKATLRWLGGASLALAGMAIVWSASVPWLAELSGQESLRRARLMRPIVYTDGCVLREPEIDLRECKYGPATAEIEVVLIGDSHAAHWFPALKSIADSHGWHLTARIKSGCSIAFVAHTTSAGRPFTECDPWREQVLSELRQTRPDAVILSSYAGQPGLSAVDWVAGMTRAITDLRQVADRVVYIEDVPAPGFDMVECLSSLSWWSWREDADDCAFDRDEALLHQTWEPVTIAQLDGVEYLSMLNVVCPGERCVGIQGELLVFRDSHHLATDFVMSLVPALDALVTDATGIDMSVAP